MEDTLLLNVDILKNFYFSNSHADVSEKKTTPNRYVESFFDFKWERNIGAYNKLRTRPFWHFETKNIIFIVNSFDLPLANLKNVVNIFHCSRNILCLSFLELKHPTASFENLVFIEPLEFYIRIRIFGIAWMKERLRGAIMLSWKITILRKVAYYKR